MLEPLFETECLFTRHFVAGDLGDFAALCADPEVMRYVGDRQTLPRSEVARWIGVCQQKYAARGYGTSAVFEREMGEFMGYCGVVRAPGNNFDELIYVFHRSAWGQGYATEVGRAMLTYVFGHSQLERIYATIHADNFASQKVTEKLGMRFEKAVTEPDGVVRFYVAEREAFSKS